MRIDDRTLQALQSALQFRQQRQELINSNIANAETPGYKSKRLDFEDSLARALDVDGNESMKSENEKHFDVGSGGFKNLQPEVYDDPNGIVTEDGNNVDRDTEMTLMAENKVMYDAAVQLINKKLGMMKYILASEQR